ncbi:helicase associated domain-containing protein [Streptomyces sp. NPDC086766]|uniref:helicase associated domain-containing protein n=1 Tax=Streptomyces sp. NPDC086766 TaxID=3365754 RepID=UPI0037F8D171
MSEKPVDLAQSREDGDQRGDSSGDGADGSRSGHEEPGRQTVWVQSVRLGWDNLTTVQQWMCEQVLGIEPATEDEKPKPRRTQADKWAMSYESAKQFFEREGHLRVPRKHVERIIVGEDHEERELRLGAWIGNQRSRAAPERVEQLSAIGMRWT